MTESEQKIMDALRELYKLSQAQHKEQMHFLEGALGVSARPEPKPKAEDKPWEKWTNKDKPVTGGEGGFKL